MSTSTWTTTTSATGMPTMEPAPNRQRSSSFRFHREDLHLLSPTSSSVSNSSSPADASPTTCSAMISGRVKLRSMSVASISSPTFIAQHRFHSKEFASSQQTLTTSRPALDVTSSDQKFLSSTSQQTVATACQQTQTPGGHKQTTPGLGGGGAGHHFTDAAGSDVEKKGFLPKMLSSTSDYDSSDSPTFGSDLSGEHLISKDPLAIIKTKRKPPTMTGSDRICEVWTIREICLK